MRFVLISFRHIVSFVSSCSALRDRRFPPIQSKELPTLECTVSILTNYETAGGYLDWEVNFHVLRCSYLPTCSDHEMFSIRYYCFTNVHIKVTFFVVNAGWKAWFNY